MQKLVDKKEKQERKLTQVNRKSNIPQHSDRRRTNISNVSEIGELPPLLMER